MSKSKSTESNRPLNLQNPDDLETFKDENRWGNKTTLLNFVQGQKPNAFYNGHMVFPCIDCNCHSLILIENQIETVNSDFAIIEKTSSPSAVLVKTKKRYDANKGCKNFLLINGDVGMDEPQTSVVDDLSEMQMPTTSFVCLNQFYSEEEGLSRLSSGDLVIADYTVDETRPLSAKDKNILKRRKNNVPEPPELGFSLVRNSWHRSGTVLLQDKERGLCILMGQDEGTYFGVELPKMVNKIADAFKILIPKEVIGKKYIRQGEWFMVPVAKEDVPEHADCVACTDREICLPLESSDSNKHRVFSGDIRIGRDGLIYAFNSDVEHDEHESLSGVGWSTFYKNTAIRSFSQEGVD